MDEKGIVEHLKQYNKDTFRIIVQQYQTYVMNICNGFVHNKEDAEDISQDVFIEFYQSISKFRGDSKISTWLYRIAVNKSLNFLRKNKKYKKHESIENAINNEDPESEHPELFLENQDKIIALHSAINSLPANQKTAFVLNKFNNLPYQEISEVMNKSLSSVESLIHRAKLNLQKELMTFYKKNIK